MFNQDIVTSLQILNNHSLASFQEVQDAFQEAWGTPSTDGPYLRFDLNQDGHVQLHSNTGLAEVRSDTLGTVGVAKFATPDAPWSTPYEKVDLSERDFVVTEASILGKVKAVHECPTDHGPYLVADLDCGHHPAQVLWPAPDHPLWDHHEDEYMQVPPTEGDIVAVEGMQSASTAINREEPCIVVQAYTVTPSIKTEESLGIALSSIDHPTWSTEPTEALKAVEKLPLDEWVAISPDTDTPDKPAEQQYHMGGML